MFKFKWYYHLDFCQVVKLCSIFFFPLLSSVEYWYSGKCNFGVLNVVSGHLMGPNLPLSYLIKSLLIYHIPSDKPLSRILSFNINVHDSWNWGSGSLMSQDLGTYLIDFGLNRSYNVFEWIIQIRFEVKCWVELVYMQFKCHLDVSTYKLLALIIIIEPHNFVGFVCERGYWIYILTSPSCT